MHDHSDQHVHVTRVFTTGWLIVLPSYTTQSVSQSVSQSLTIIPSIINELFVVVLGCIVFYKARSELNTPPRTSLFIHLVHPIYYNKALME